MHPAADRRPGKRLTQDHRLREELEYCAPRGIPHSVFLRWSDDDRDKALAWARLGRATCSDCGTRPDEWEADRDAYRPDHHICQGCLEIAQHRGQIKDIAERTPGGVKVYLQPKEG